MERRAFSRIVTVVLWIAASACGDAPPEAPAATAPAVEMAENGTPVPSSAESSGPADGPARDEALGSRRGLAELTREVVEQARRRTTDPLRFIPDAAQFLAEVQPPALLAHAELRTLWTKAEHGSSDVRTAMEVVRACLGRLEAIERIILGFDQDDRAVLVGHATGLGTEGTWRCFQDESTARGKPFDLVLTRTPRGEGPQIREDGGDVGYFIDDDTVVLVSKDWIAEAEARLRGEGTAAIDGSLAVVAGRVQPDAPLWVVGRITGPAEIGLAGTPMAGIDDVSVSLGLPGSDLELRIEADAGEKADATRVRDELQRQLREFEGVLPLMGFPGTVAPKLAFETEGDLVSLAFVLTEAELRGLREGIEKMMP